MTFFLLFLGAFFLWGWLESPCRHKHSVEAPKMEKVLSAVQRFWVPVHDGFRFCLKCRVFFRP